MAYAGIDYGRGLTNIDHATGIRYGVISQHSVTQAWADSSEAEYGPPHCPKCGNEADRPEEFGESFADLIPDDYTSEPHECDDFVCVQCMHFFGSESAYGDDPIGYFVDDNEYTATNCLDSDIMITRSPFYTFAPFCSPCVPGAGNLDNAEEYEQGRIVPITSRERQPDGTVPTYCFGHDWFEGGKAPYRVFRVADDTEVLPE